jgi:RNA polymerase sigma-70 factor (ECF subfamily)
VNSRAVFRASSQNNSVGHPGCTESHERNGSGHGDGAGTIHRLARDGDGASRLSGDEQLAEEIAVQSLGAAVTTIRRFNPRKSNLRTWLYGIARRLVYVELRRQSRRKSVPPSAQVPIAELPELSDGDDMAASVTSRLEAQRQISELSRILSEAEMEVLTLHYVEQFSLEEIGRIMGANEHWADRFVSLTLAARPAPGAGFEARALTAMAAAHPRRHSRLVTIIIVAALLLLLAACVFAAVRYFFVEGTLMFLEDDGGKPPAAPREVTRFFSGDLQWSESSLYGRPRTIDLSPDGHQVCFHRNDGFPPQKSDVFVAHRDGSDEVNLTAALGGVNCCPKWSPDASMIGFSHADPAEGQRPCRAGWHAWVISADGFDAWPILPASRGTSRFSGWSPDGARVLLWEGPVPDDGAPEGVNRGSITTDIWGQDIRPLPNVGIGAEWSPDGTKIVSVPSVLGHLGGDPGMWNQLLLTAADGSDPEVLVEQFVADKDIEAHLLAQGGTAGSIVSWAGPTHTVWSPSGDKIAFLAAMPFDPHGPYHILQVEVWVYDLTTDELIRITDDDVWQHSLTWR